MVHIEPPPRYDFKIWILNLDLKIWESFHGSIPSDLKFTVRRHDSIIPRHDPFLDIIPPASNYFQSAIQKQAIKKSAGSIR